MISRKREGAVMGKRNIGPHTLEIRSWKTLRSCPTRKRIELAVAWINLDGEEFVLFFYIRGSVHLESNLTFWRRNYFF